MLASMAITMEELYPNATEEERAEAQQRLEAYLRLIRRILERLESERIDENQKQAYDESGRPHY